MKAFHSPFFRDGRRQLRPIVAQDAKEVRALREVTVLDIGVADRSLPKRVTVAAVSLPVLIVISVADAARAERTRRATVVSTAHQRSHRDERRHVLLLLKNGRRRPHSVHLRHRTEFIAID